MPEKLPGDVALCEALQHHLRDLIFVCHVHVYDVLTAATHLANNPVGPVVPLIGQGNKGRAHRHAADQRMGPLSNQEIAQADYTLEQACLAIPLQNHYIVRLRLHLLDDVLGGHDVAGAVLDRVGQKQNERPMCPHETVEDGGQIPGVGLLLLLAAQIGSEPGVDATRFQSRHGDDGSAGFSCAPVPFVLFEDRPGLLRIDRPHGEGRIGPHHQLLGVAAHLPHARARMLFAEHTEIALVQGPAIESALVEPPSIDARAGSVDARPLAVGFGQVDDPA